MDTEQAAEGHLEECRRSKVRELGFYRIRQELRKVSIQMYTGLATFMERQTQSKGDFPTVLSAN